jgi:hypothetical protein
VAIDSFKAIHRINGDANRSRALIYDLAVSMASWQATTFLVGEYLRSDIGNCQSLRSPMVSFASGASPGTDDGSRARNPQAARD